MTEDVSTPKTIKRFHAWLTTLSEISYSMRISFCLRIASRLYRFYHSLTTLYRTFRTHKRTAQRKVTQQVFHFKQVTSAVIFHWSGIGEWSLVTLLLAL